MTSSLVFWETLSIKDMKRSSGSSCKGHELIPHLSNGEVFAVISADVCVRAFSQSRQHRIVLREVDHALKHRSNDSRDTTGTGRSLFRMNENECQ